MEPSAALIGTSFILGASFILGIIIACKLVAKLIKYWPIILILVWYTFSALHIRWYYLQNWYSPEHHFKEGEGDIWAITNWVVSPVATPGYYIYKFVATNVPTALDSVLRWIGAI